MKKPKIGEIYKLNTLKTGKRYKVVAVQKGGRYEYVVYYRVYYKDDKGKLHSMKLEVFNDTFKEVEK